MQSRSVFTQQTNTYKAGLDLGNQLLDLKPDVVFLFSSIHYENPVEILNGMNDILGNNVVIAGCSGDGFYNNVGADDIGISALGMNTQKKAQWKLASASKLSQNTTKATISVLNNLTKEEKPSLIFMLADFRINASEIEKVIENEIDVPIVGGLAGDDYQMKNCYLFKNKEVVEDNIIGVGVYGDIDFEIYVGNDIQPVGKSGTITSAQGTLINTIDNMQAMDFIEQETGKPVLITDRSISSLMIIDGDNHHIKRLRSIQIPKHNDRSIELYGGIEIGAKVRVCIANAETLHSEVKKIVNTIANSKLSPQAALIFSCAGRKYFLGEEIQNEVAILKDNISSSIQISGFPTFGEISPIRLPNHSYSKNKFHNMTYILTLFN